jgi:IS6 family transposase
MYYRLLAIYSEVAFSKTFIHWHVDETYIRVCGKWRYLWRIVDQKGQFVDFRLTARRDLKAAKAFLKQAQSNCGLYPPATIVTDKAPTYPAIIEACVFRPNLATHSDTKWQLIPKLFGHRFWN